MGAVATTLLPATVIGSYPQPGWLVLGVLDLGDPSVEGADAVARRIRAGLRHVPAERLVPVPDCGMKYLSRATGKLSALAAGAAAGRGERVSA